MKMVNLSIKKYPWIIPTIIFSLLLILGALAHPLWGDEAETAIFGRNILKYGVPKGWDGTNIMGLGNGIVLNSDLINHTSPWPQYYLTALSFKLFGETSFSARLPFILIAIATIPLLYFICLKIVGNKRTAFLSVLLYSTSISIVLFSYQARYYSLIIFSGLLFFYGAFNLLAKSHKPKIFFLVGGVIYFYSNYLSFPMYFTALFIAMLVYLYIKKYPRDSIVKFIFSYLFLGLIIGLLFAPWYLYLQPLSNRGGVLFKSSGFLLRNFWIFGNEYIRIFNPSNIFPIGIMLLCVVVVFLRRRTLMHKSIILLLLAIVATYLFIVILLSSLVMADSPLFEIRYNLIIFPFLMILIAMILEEVWRWNKAIFWVVLSLFVFTNIFTLTSSPRSHLFEYLREVIHPYSTPNKAVADYLNNHAKEGDTALINLDHHHEPLIFLLNKKIKFIARVVPVNSALFPKNYSILPKYTYSFVEPDWIILFGKQEMIKEQSLNNLNARDIRDFPINLEDDYTETVLPIFYADTTRPEIVDRSFAEINPKYEEQIFIYRRKH